jgi:hypothetical protein
MFHTRNRIVAATIALTLATPGLAAVAKPAATAKKTAPMITPNADGSVTRAQLQAEVKQVFNRADTNHDGFMSRAEFAARMSLVINGAPARIGTTPTKEQAQRMLDAANAAFNDVDTNHDGKLSLAEAMYRPLKEFDAMDTNHDGVLTLAEKQAAHEAATQGPSTGPVGPPVGGPGR